MAWLQLTLDTGQAHAEELVGLLEKFGASSVSLSALSDEPLFSEPGENVPHLWQQIRITALLHRDTDLDTLLVCLRHRLGDKAIVNTHIEQLEDRDWVKAYQDSHGPQIYSGKLCVCPGWSTPPEGIPLVLILDPGLAFGTGTHATTALCLEWLTGHEVRGRQVIDFGCGSGILALSALLLGAEHAYAVDVDHQALEATRSNAEKNGLASRLTIVHAGEMQLPKADILLANILLNPLMELAQRFTTLLRPGGELVLSGLLAQQAEECLGVYQRWFNMQLPVYRQEWALLEGCLPLTKDLK